MLTSPSGVERRTTSCHARWTRGRRWSERPHRRATLGVDPDHLELQAGNLDGLVQIGAQCLTWMWSSVSPSMKNGSSGSAAALSPPQRASTSSLVSAQYVTQR